MDKLGDLGGSECRPFAFAQIATALALFFALSHSTRTFRKIQRFSPVLAEAFNHSWIAGVELKIRFRPGNETTAARLWRIYKWLPAQSMHWDAPITVSVYRERRGKKRQALCMSFYIAGNVLYIAQIQGVSGTDVPKELRAWPKIFMEACRTFARRESLQAVMVPKAATLYSYRHPFLRADLLPLARQNALGRIRDRITVLYDKNALDLGFVLDGQWFRSDIKQNVFRGR